MNWESQGIALPIALLVASLVRPFGLAAAAWLILRVLRVRHPASRHTVWTAVLIGMMLLPVVSVIAPHWKAPLPALSRKHDAAGRAIAVGSAEFTGYDLPAVETGRRTAGHRAGSLSYERLAIWCYFAGLFAMVVYRVAGWALLRRVMSRSRPLRAGRLRESADVLTPVAVGVLRPAVLLPAGWRTWNTATRRAVLAHEFAHLRRHDTLISALGRCVQCVFWFHPLAWWISRKISNLAELACDAAVLERVHDPAGYSRILLEFAGAVNRAGGRVALPGLAMAASSGMGRRIDQVFELSSGTMKKLSRPGVLLAVTGVPVMCLAATVGLGEPQQVGRQRIAPQAVPPSKPAATPKFEVISVKPSTNCGDGGGRGGGKGGRSWSPGRLSLECQTVMGLVQMAYVRFADGKPRRPGLEGLATAVPIEGGPSWINSIRYDIDAKAAGVSSLEMMSGPMMQALLEERFKLRVRREIRTVPVYALTAAKGGPKLQAAQPGKCIPFDFDHGPPPPRPAGQPIVPNCGFFQQRSPNDGVYTYGQTIAGLCRQFSAWLDRDVIDKTGIAGVFDVHLALSFDDVGLRPRGDDAPTDPAAPAIPADPFGAISAAVQRLGLKLVPAKGPGEFFVIDRVEKPSEN